MEFRVGAVSGKNKMEQKINLLNMFSDYEPPEQLRDLLSQAALVAADIDMENRRVHALIHSENYIPKRLLSQVSRDITTLYELHTLTIDSTHPASELAKIEKEELMNLFVSRNSMTRGSLAGADWEWADLYLTIRLKANGRDALLEQVPAVDRELRERFAADVHIDVVAGQAYEGQALFDHMESLRTSMISSLPATGAGTSDKQEKKAAPPSDALYGKPFKGPGVPMNTLSMDMGTVIVEGRVFNVDHKELKKRNAWVVKFDMTDNTGSVRVSRFFEAAEAKPFIENVKVGSVFKVQGKLIEDRFENEMVLKPYALMPGSMPKRLDTAVGEKRVELHLHTSMSNMDALTSTKAAIKQAAAWGHKAIAITDHGCVQSFTDALHSHGGRNQRYH